MTELIRSKKVNIETDIASLISIEDLFYIGMSREINTPFKDGRGFQVNLGAGKSKILSGSVSLNYPECDFEKDRLPYDDESVDVFHIYHVLEHLSNPKHLLKECERTLKLGGYINIVVPYYSSSLQASCLDHRSSFNERTWNNTFRQNTYDNGFSDWKLEEHLNIIIGIEENNLCLMTQLIKTGD